MAEQHFYLISQAGQHVAVVEANDENNAIARAKGLSHVLLFLPSLPMTATPVCEPPDGIPTFNTEYFELLGFRK
jgi:hypothetical protein